ncbi:MAG: preprotein translocase subunit SecG, partial [Hyphomicrobium aestuarii]|nr:preprotein translocase subunit SecG [Hyphomicrobium aestuarii]
MMTVLLVIHMMIAAALIGFVLIQKSEGGALGIGGGDHHVDHEEDGHH